MEKKKRQRLEVTVKETIDYMYALLADYPDGVVYSVHRSLGAQAGQIVTVLVKRGIINRTCIASENGNCYRYKWAADLPPTKVLYGSVAQELRDNWKKKAQNVKEKKAAKKVAPVEEHEPVVKQEPKPVPEEDVKALEELKEKLGEPEQEEKFHYITDESVDNCTRIMDLWDMIKLLGGYIEDNELRVRITVRLR